MLGWRILEQGEYRLELPFISEDEERLVCAAQERFREETRTREAHGDEEGRRLVGSILEREAEAAGLFLERRQAGYLGEIAHMHICGFGFLEPLTKDPQIEEISVIGPNRPVYVFLRKRGWMSVNACFEDEKSIADMINRMSRGIGRHITMQNPRLDAMLPGGSRLHASLPPISQGEITIRKFRDRPFSPMELCGNKTMGLDEMAFLSVLMQCDFSILIAGNTASGKTTTLNALFSFVPMGERVIITEETPEISIPHHHQLRLVANRDMGIGLRDLVYDSLRMRPDRMIVGEERNREEAEALFDVLLAGQARGSYATFHAQSAQEALSRLRSMGIRESDLSSMDCIVVQRRMLEYDSRKRKTCEKRRVVEVFDVGKKAPAAGCASKECRFEKSALFEKAAGDFGLTIKEMRHELEARKRLIAKSGQDYAGSFAYVQKALYGGG